jgi:mannose-6-phosphate isomerase-like protein (cupin superfamily)
MTGFLGNIEERTEENRDFRRVLYTGSQLQLVLMSLQPGDELGEEVHPHTDQFFRVEDGRGEAVIEGHVTEITSDTALVIPAGTLHNIRNTGSKPLKLYTLYAPPQHPDGTVHPTREDAEKAHA